MESFDDTQEAADRTTAEDLNRATSLYNLSTSLTTRYQNTKATEDLNKAVTYAQEAVDLTAKENPDRAIPLNQLSIVLSIKHQTTRNTDYIDKAVDSGQEAVNLTPKEHPNRAIYLYNLSVWLDTRYQNTKATDDLNRAVACAQEAVDLTAKESPDRATYLNQLGIILNAKYQTTKKTDYIDKAVDSGQEAVDLATKEDPSRTTYLFNLSVWLDTRSQDTNATDDLDKAIISAREAVDLTAKEHLYRAAFLYNLSILLATRLQNTNATEDLNNATISAQEAVDLTAKEDHNRAIYVAHLKYLLNIKLYIKVLGFSIPFWRVLLFLVLPSILLPTLEIFAKSRHADPAECSSRITGEVGFVGNPDFYGLGIRLGMYGQWIASLVAYIFVPGERHSLAAAYAITSMALAVSLFYLAYQNTCVFDVDVIIILCFFFGGMFNVVAPLTGGDHVFGGLLYGFSSISTEAFQQSTKRTREIAEVMSSQRTLSALRSITGHNVKDLNGQHPTAEIHHRPTHAEGHTQASNELPPIPVAHLEPYLSEERDQESTDQPAGVLATEDQPQSDTVQSNTLGTTEGHGNHKRPSREPEHLTQASAFLIYPMLLFSCWFWISMRDHTTDPFTPTPGGTFFFLLGRIDVTPASHFLAFFSIWLAITPYLRIIALSLVQNHHKLAISAQIIQAPFVVTLIVTNIVAFFISFFYGFYLGFVNSRQRRRDLQPPTIAVDNGREVSDRYRLETGNTTGQYIDKNMDDVSGKSLLCFLPP